MLHPTASVSRVAWSVALLVLLSACGSGGGAPSVTAAAAGGPAGGDEGAFPGPWVPPTHTLAIGDTYDIENEQAGPWAGPGGCAGGLQPGAQALSDWMTASFPVISSVGGYACRPVTGAPSVMSVHATGRALDLFIPLAGGEANNVAGDPVANWLVENAGVIGVQFVIWDGWTWDGGRASGSKSRGYDGAHPHHDHIHVELSLSGAAMDTPWFGGGTPPAEPPAQEDADDAAVTSGGSGGSGDAGGSGSSGGTSGSGSSGGSNDTEDDSFTPTYILDNGDFEDGDDDWSLSGDFWADAGDPDATHSRGGDGYAAGGVGSDGWVKNSASGTLKQSFEVPSGADEIYVKVYVNVTSDESDVEDDAFDRLKVTIVDSSGDTVATICSLSNLDEVSSKTSYTRYTKTIKNVGGDTLTIKFVATSDSTLPTVFRIDDVSVLAR